jgi:hypothetical protein
LRCDDTAADAADCSAAPGFQFDAQPRRSGDNRVWVIRGILPIIIRLLLSENSMLRQNRQPGCFAEFAKQTKKIASNRGIPSIRSGHARNSTLPPPARATQHQPEVGGVAERVITFTTSLSTNMSSASARVRNKIIRSLREHARTTILAFEG